MKTIKAAGIILSILGTCMCFVLADTGLPSSVADDSTVGKAPFMMANVPGVYFDSMLGYEIPSGNSSLGKPPILDVIPGPPPHTRGVPLQYDSESFFYIYTDKNAPHNHFIPSGWMGDYGDITIDDASKENPADGKTCFKIHYSAQGSQHNGWAGMFWQEPINNWGDKTGGYNLSGFNRLTFWARGQVGGEEISVFKVGGIVGKNQDSGTAFIGPVVLSKDWQKYTIDLNGVNLSHIEGGFAWATGQPQDPAGMTFYLDEIRFEK